MDKTKSETTHFWEEVMNSKWKVKAKLGHVEKIHVCRKPDSKSPQYLSLGDLEQNEIFRESKSILQQRAGFS